MIAMIVSRATTGLDLRWHKGDVMNTLILSQPDLPIIFALRRTVCSWRARDITSTAPLCICNDVPECLNRRSQQAGILG